MLRKRILSIMRNKMRAPLKRNTRFYSRQPKSSSDPFIEKIDDDEIYKIEEMEFDAKSFQKEFGHEDMDKLNEEYEKEVKRIEKELLGDDFIEPDIISTEQYLKEDLNRPIKDFEMPDYHVKPFNYKTFRYKDIMDEDFTPIGAQSEHLIGLEMKAKSFTDSVLETIYNLVKEEKGRDIVVINIEHKTNWVPRMIIATAESARHCLAIANTIKSELRKLKLVKNAKIESNEGNEWVVLSTGTIVLEIMTQESRDYLDIERLWVLKRSSQETFFNDQEEERFMYDEEDGMWEY